MNPAREKYYRGLFLAGTIYDIPLGIIFMFFFKYPFELLGITEKIPKGAYISLIGAFLFVIGIAYLLIYLGDLLKNRDLIIVGALYKLAYCSIGIYYFAIGDYPHIIFIALFGVIDLIFFVLMAECAIFINKTSRA